MDVIFVQFGKRSQPRGMVDLSSFLGQRGYSSKLVKLDRIGSETEEPAFVGLSAFTETSGQLRRAMAAARQRWPRAKIIVGGPHIVPDVLSREHDLHDLADYLVTGEGEYAMLRILGGCDPGVVYGSPLSNADYERLPLPSLDIVARHFTRPDRMTPFNRGCPHCCSFCRDERRPLRLCPPDRVVAYLKQFAARFRKPLYFVQDDVFVADIKWLREFAKQVDDQHSTVPLRAFIHGSEFNEERLDLLRHSHVLHASMGAESGDQKVLDLASKRTTPERYVEIDAMFRAQHQGPKLHCLWMLGLPGETRDSLLRTIDLAKQVGQRDPNFGFATPYPGTKFYRIHDRHGRLVDDNWASWHPQRIIFVPFGVDENALRQAMAAGRAIRKK